MLSDLGIGEHVDPPGVADEIPLFAQALEVGGGDADLLNISGPEVALDLGQAKNEVPLRRVHDSNLVYFKTCL